ncbi:MAG TPA: glycerophosphodiester phosphodiesterase family protein [Candidatus Dormibacteraeota bacterium]|nr:glycerophosphodiester phosphodiesterase family protein [Candidatus Dormibacteraeota bacterium]
MTPAAGAPSSLHAARLRAGHALLCGHRGASATHPENTVAAVVAALETGCAAVEVDVHVTADGGLAVIHDASVDRTTDGSGPVAAMTAAEVVALDAGSWRSPRFAGTRVPLLADVLAACGDRAMLMVELKHDFDARPDAAALVVAEIERCGSMDRTALLAFDHRHLEVAAGAAAGVARVALCGSLPEDPATLVATLGAAALGPPARLVDGPLCDAVHAVGGLVVAWTVDDPAVALELARAGVDVVVSNDPAAVGPALRSASPRG